MSTNKLEPNIELNKEKFTRDKDWDKRPIREGKLINVTRETIVKPKHTIYKFIYQEA